MGTSISFRRPDGKEARGYLPNAQAGNAPGRRRHPGVGGGLQEQIKGWPIVLRHHVRREQHDARLAELALRCETRLEQPRVMRDRRRLARSASQICALPEDPAIAWMTPGALPLGEIARCRQPMFP